MATRSKPRRRSGNTRAGGRRASRRLEAEAGLGATAAAVLTGGGSLTVKAGTSALRVARRTGHLTTRFQAALSGQIRSLDFQWEKVPAWLVRGNGIDALVRNRTALSRFRTTVADLGRIHRETGS